MASDKEVLSFPDTLAEFGYEFADGKLKNIKTGEPFQFVVREGDQAYNQKHYEALGEVITQEVYTLLEKECNLKRSPVPTNAEKKPSTFIFLSDDALSNPDKLMIFIHGSGVVRAGQWARRLIINDKLESGTQIPFIKEAQKDGFGVLVMNTNDNVRSIDGKTVRIKESSNPESHAFYVWKKYVRKAKAKHIAVIAHSFGGCVTTALFQEEKEDFVNRVFGVALTDSVHYISKPKAFVDLVKISRNWVSSTKPLDKPVQTMAGDIKRVSAGVNVHEETSWSSFQSIFKFFRKRYDIVTKGGSESPEEEEDEEVPMGKSKSLGAATTTAGRIQDSSLDRSMSVDQSSTYESTEEFSLDRSMSVDDTPDAGDGAKAAPKAHDMSDSDSDDEGQKKKKTQKMDE